jgi:hypothetical protein
MVWVESIFNGQVRRPKLAQIPCLRYDFILECLHGVWLQAKYSAVAAQNIANETVAGDTRPTSHTAVQTLARYRSIPVVACLSSPDHGCSVCPSVPTDPGACNFIVPSKFVLASRLAFLSAALWPRCRLTRPNRLRQPRNMRSPHGTRPAASPTSCSVLSRSLAHSSPTPCYKNAS